MRDSLYLKYLQSFSVITVGSDKIPLYSWKNQQIKRLDEKTLVHQIQNTNFANIGLVTGFEDLEVLDIDLKVFSTTSEKNDFWNEFIGLLREFIYDFDEKFVIYKTQNAGFHILYKTKRVDKNKKIASLKGHTEAIIETRGIGGYVIAYHGNQVGEKTYFDINYITDEDREILMNTALSYNYVEPKEEKIETEVKKVYKTTGNDVTPWDDFNLQTDILTVVADDFVIVKELPKKIFLKRHGATSAHSGYIFKNDNRMYLHSTGTIYPAEKQITPYSAYAIKHHNGDYSVTAKDLYSQGFGDRLKKEIEEKSEVVKQIEIDQQTITATPFPLEIFPENFQKYILECNSKLDAVIDYMGCALLWVTSLCVGNSYRIKVKSGWEEVPTVWFSLVGRAGVGKTPSVKNILFPLIKENSRKVKGYIVEKKKFDNYSRLSKSEKEDAVEVLEPSKTQFIVDDVTQESLVNLHQHVPTGIGVFKDELAGFFKDMNKYREGSDLEFWLSIFSGNDVVVNRMTRADLYIESPFIPILGGIQPGIFSSVYTDEKKANGFLDRMLISYPEISIENYNENEISTEAIEWYDAIITNFKRKIDATVNFDSNGSVVKKQITFSEPAKEVWIKAFNDITARQNSEEESEYFKSIFPKQKTYIPRFAFLIEALKNFENKGEISTFISAESMESAVKLSEYFITMARKIALEINQENDLKKSIDKKSISTFDKVKDAYSINKNFNKSQVANLLGISRATLHRYLKELEK